MSSSRATVIRGSTSGGRAPTYASSDAARTSRQNSPNMAHYYRMNNNTSSSSSVSAARRSRESSQQHPQHQQQHYDPDSTGGRRSNNNSSSSYDVTHAFGNTTSGSSSSAAEQHQHARPSTTNSSRVSASGPGESSGGGGTYTFHYRAMSRRVGAGVDPSTSAAAIVPPAIGYSIQTNGAEQAQEGNEYDYHLQEDGERGGRAGAVDVPFHPSDSAEDFQQLMMNASMSSYERRSGTTGGNPTPSVGGYSSGVVTARESSELTTAVGSAPPVHVPPPRGSRNVGGRHRSISPSQEGEEGVIRGESKKSFRSLSPIGSSIGEEEQYDDDDEEGEPTFYPQQQHQQGGAQRNHGQTSSASFSPRHYTYQFAASGERSPSAQHLGAMDMAMMLSAARSGPGLPPSVSPSGGDVSPIPQQQQFQQRGHHPSVDGGYPTIAASTATTEIGASGRRQMRATPHDRHVEEPEDLAAPSRTRRAGPVTTSTSTGRAATPQSQQLPHNPHGSAISEMLANMAAGGGMVPPPSSALVNNGNAIRGNFSHQQQQNSLLGQHQAMMMTPSQQAKMKERQLRENWKFLNRFSEQTLNGPSSWKHGGPEAYFEF